MDKCKSCLSRSQNPDGICPVCGIERQKQKKDLSKNERKRRFYARAIRCVSIFHLCGVIALIALIIAMASYLPQPQNPYILYVGYFFMIVLVVLCMILSYGLWCYKKWSYYLALGLYGVSFLSGVIEFKVESVPSIIIPLILVYVLANKTSRSIFSRTWMSVPLNNPSAMN